MCVPGQVGFEVIGIGRQWKLCEEARQVRERLDAVGTGRFDQGVQPRACFGTMGRVAENPSFVPDYRRADRILYPVRVQRDFLISQEVSKFRILRESTATPRVRPHPE